MDIDVKEEVQLPENLETQRTRTICGPELNYHVNTATSALMYMTLGYDNSWNFEKWAKQLDVKIVKNKNQDMEFEIVNIDPSIANALRRIMIAEVPTMAIEHVFFINNTSIMMDEILAHRLGLVPIKVDPNLFDYKTDSIGSTEHNTIVFKMDVKCTRENGNDINNKVTSGHLRWLQGGSEIPDETRVRFQSNQESVAQDIQPVHDDILLVKMKPNQEIQLEAHCVKGQGKDHAKWQPVGTAWYRPYPEVVIKKEISAELQEALVRECPDIFTIKKTKEGNRVVAQDVRDAKFLERARRLSGEEEYKDCIEVRRKKEHLIFNIESIGILPPDEIFIRSLDILIDKCDQLLDGL